MALHGKKKYVDKPCLRFTTTSALPTHCALTSEPVSGSLSLHPLFYRFLQSWPHIAHPFVCTFVNAGHYTRANCLYPLVGHCEGVCRDFAVLGYCEASIECSEQHVYECPDLLSGECPNKFCKLSHVCPCRCVSVPDHYQFLQWLLCTCPHPHPWCG